MNTTMNTTDDFQDVSNSTMNSTIYTNSTGLPDITNIVTVTEESDEWWLLPPDWWEEYLLMLAQNQLRDHIVATCVLIWIITGTIGNVLSVFVWTRHTMWKLSVAPYLVALGITDLIVLYTGGLDAWLQHQHLMHIYIRHMSEFSCKAIFFLRGFARQYSAWLLVCLSIERLIWVLWPLRARSLCSKKKSAITMAVLFVILFLLNIHHIIGSRYETLTYYSVFTNSTWTFTDCRLNMASESYRYFYHFIADWLSFITFSAAPFCIILITNTTILVKLLNSKRKQKMGEIDQTNWSSDNPTANGDPRNSETRRSNRDRSMTILLIGLAVAFLITTMPVTIYNFLRNIGIRHVSLILYPVAIILLYLNYTLNFIIYSVSARKFRKELRRIFRCRRKRDSDETVASEMPTLPSVNSDVREDDSKPTDVATNF